MSQKSTIETIDQIINHAKEKGVIHLSTQDTMLHNNLITIKDKVLVNFGSCSYLGLEFHPKLRIAAKNAIDAYGTQFSSSRAYVSPKYYVELEEKLEKIFGSPTVVTPTTTLGHLSALPVLVGSNDVVILDHQVHSSIQTAAQQLKAKMIPVELLRHNRIDILEKRILELKGKYNKIWYMADGIYSMFGDTTPIDEIYSLLNKYEEFHFYVDDAHAMSCMGENGKGFVLSGRKIHDRMVVATSFAKAFATGGGALIFPNRALAQKVRNCGSTLITSGPMQPSALGAAIASADIHLSEEIIELQRDLQENIKYAHLLLEKYELPNLSEPNSPIFFVAVGLPKVGYKLIDRMMQDGHYLNLGIFPAVPIKNTGIRFTITRLHTFEQISKMIQSLAKHHEAVVSEEGYSIQQIYKAFKIETYSPQQLLQPTDNFLSFKTHKSINELDTQEWDLIMKERGAFDSHYLAVLEDSFSGNEKRENNWEFDYYIVRDENGTIILATFSTLALIKDDMFVPDYISTEVEKKRVNDPYFLTSNTLTLGSPISEGDHLYVNKESKHWRKALLMLIEKLELLQQFYKASNVVIRDLNAEDQDLDGFMVDNGFFKIGMPDSAIIKNMDWHNDASFYETLSTRSKRHFRENIKRFENEFIVKIINTPTKSEINQFYELYLNVKRHNLELNTFELPFRFFEKMARSKSWEFIVLSLKNSEISRPVAVVFAYKTAEIYNGLIVGIDYKVNYQYNVYRQSIYQVIKRAKDLNSKAIPLGFSAIIEKKKFGADVKKTCAYVQTKDNYNMEALATMTGEDTKKAINYGANKRRVLPV